MNIFDMWTLLPPKMGIGQEVLELCSIEMRRWNGLGGEGGPFHSIPLRVLLLRL